MLLNRMRFVGIFLAVVMVCVGLWAHGDRADAAGPTGVYFQEQWLAESVVDQGQLLAPVRRVAEALGAQVSWDAGAVLLVKGADTVCLRPGSRTAEIRGEKHTLGVAPRMQDGRMLAPLRFMAEGLGCGVDWENRIRVVLREPELGEAGQVRPGDAFPLYEGPDPLVISRPPGEVPGSAAVEVLAKRPEWVHIRHESLEGWLPAWYLEKDEGPAVAAVAADFQALGRSVAGFLYPEGPTVVSFETGDLVRPVLEWADWVMVERLYFDLPAVRWAWVPAEVLSAEAEPRQGFLREGSTVYTVDKYGDISRAEPETQDFTVQVRLGEHRGEFVRVEAPAGWRAWTKAENLYFSQDPEEQLRVQVHDLLAGWYQLYRVDETVVDLQTIRTTPLTVAAEYFTSVVTVIDLDDPAKWPPQQGRIKYLEENRGRLSPDARERVRAQIDFWDRELRELYLGVPSRGNAYLRVEADLVGWGQIEQDSVRFYLQGPQSDYHLLDTDEILRSSDDWVRVGYEGMRQLAAE